MSTWISNRGVLHPAKEEVGLMNKSKEVIKSDFIFGTREEGVAQPGENFIYRGPDREALRELADQGLETLGKDFSKDPEFLQAVRNQGFNTVKDYLKFIGYDEKKEQEKFEERAHSLKSHEISESVKAIKILAGGTAPTRDDAIVGGFGERKMSATVTKG